MSDYDDFYSRYIGIEDANGESDSIDRNPFDPKTVSLTSKKISMDAFVRRLEQGTLKLDPEFQRAEVWNERAKSLLIESLMLRIPVPMFYFSSDENDNYTVLDGLQRMTAIQDFVLGKEYLESISTNTHDYSKKGNGLRLKGLEFLTNYNGYTISELPQVYVNRIMETEFAVTIIEPNTPEPVKRNIFRRINTGGMPLSQQEIRNALYVGPATRLLRELRKSKSFKQATCDSIKPKRAEDQELILRLLSFILRRPSDYHFNDIDAWLSETMQLINEIDKNPNLSTIHVSECKENVYRVIEDCSIDNLKRLFELAMTRSYHLFQKNAFRKIKSGRNSRSPISKSLFEMWGVELAFLDEDQFKKLVCEKKQLLSQYVELLSNPNFQMRISKNSTKSNDLPIRFNAIHTLVQNVIKDN